MISSAARFRFVAAVLAALLVATPAATQAPLPAIPLDQLPEAPRAIIGRALDEARAHPGDAVRVGRLAMLLQAWEQYETSAVLYDRLRAADPRFEWAYLGGLVETRRARHREAATRLAEAVKLAPDSVPARLAWADALFAAGDIDASAAEYATLTSGQGAPHARYGLGRALAAKGDHAGALRELDQAVALYAEFGAAWYSRGMSLRTLGRLDEAKAALAKSQQFGARWPAVDDPWLSRVRALREDGAAHAQRGLQLDRQGDVAGAIREYEAAVAVDPGHVASRVNLIALYGRQKEWPKAAAQYEAITAAGGVVPAEAHFNYGVCLGGQGQIDQAEILFRKALEANPQYANAWTSLGQVAEMRGKVEEAEANYRKALEQAPTNAAVRFNIGRMLLARRRFAEAVAEFQPLADLNVPERPRYLFGLATAHVLNGDVATGRRLSEQARDLARQTGQNDLASAIERDLAKLPQ